MSATKRSHFAKCADIEPLWQGVGGSDSMELHNALSVVQRQHEGHFVDNAQVTGQLASSIAQQGEGGNREAKGFLSQTRARIVVERLAESACRFFLAGRHFSRVQRSALR